MTSAYFIKANRIFTPVRKYGWIFTLLVALGGLWLPRLGLLVIPIMVALASLSFFRGRYWCGNFCTHGSMFDSLLYPLTKNLRIPKWFKSEIFIAGFFLFFMSNFTRGLIRVSALAGTDLFWDRLGGIFVRSYLMVVVAGGLLSLLSSRTWCSFCPMGVLQRISYKLGKWTGLNKKTDLKITFASPSMCHTCGKCARVCPMQLTPYLEISDKNQFDADACIRCSTCVENCPAGILSLESESQAVEKHRGLDLSGYENRRKITAIIESIRPLKPDVTEYTFRFQEPATVHYEAGQFILVRIQESPLMYRAYSISSFDEDGARLSITVKKVPHGYGTRIIEETFREGAEIFLEGPLGHELLLDKSAERIVMVAGGIGITPFKAMVKDLVKHPGAIREFKLIYGANREEEFLYMEELQALEASCEKFELIPVAAFDEDWGGAKGFVTDVLQEVDLEDAKIYMCGPPPMVKAALSKLKALHVPESRVHYESA